MMRDRFLAGLTTTWLVTGLVLHLIKSHPLLGRYLSCTLLRADSSRVDRSRASPALKHAFTSTSYLSRQTISATRAQPLVEAPRPALGPLGHCGTERGDRGQGTGGAHSDSDLGAGPEVEKTCRKGSGRGTPGRRDAGSECSWKAVDPGHLSRKATAVTGRARISAAWWKSTAKWTAEARSSQAKPFCTKECPHHSSMLLALHRRLQMPDLSSRPHAVRGTLLELIQDLRILR